jgi:hypothetical protein
VHIRMRAGARACAYRARAPDLLDQLLPIVGVNGKLGLQVPPSTRYRNPESAPASIGANRSGEAVVCACAHVHIRAQSTPHRARLAHVR